MKIHQNKTLKPPSLSWSKVSDHHRKCYQDKLDSLCAQGAHQSPVCLQAHCDSSSCHYRLQCEYNEIIAVIKEADETIPRRNPAIEKDWWNETLSTLKWQSIEIHQLWKSQGRPGQGPIHLERMRVRADYRRALKAAQLAPKQAMWDKIHTSMESNDTHQFWNSWKQLYAKNKSHFAPMVDGKTAKSDIADVFKNCFQSNSEPNNAEKVEELKAQFVVQYANYSQCHMESCDCNNYSISVEDVFEAISSMKTGKCADEMGVNAEHFLYAPFSLLKRLATLFNQMLRHGFVPSQFRFGFMLPIVKDNQGNHGDSSNYRGITISPIASKVFEHVLKNK